MAETVSYYAFLSGFVLTTIILSAAGGLTTYRQAATSAGTVNVPVSVSLPSGLAGLGRAALYGALGLLTLSLIFRAVAVERPPIGNLWEYTIALTWGMVLFTAVFEAAFKERALGLVMLPVAVMMMSVALAFFPSEVSPLVPALQANRILGLHVTSMVLAYSALSISFGASVLYLVQSARPTSARPEARHSSAHPEALEGRGPGTGEAMPQSSAPGAVTIRLPDTETLGEIAYWSVLVGFPLLTLGIALGAYWANSAWGRYWGWDPKETAALLTWLVYAGYLHAHGLRGWEGRRAAWLLIVAFGAVLFTYFAVNFLISGLHSYAGV
jgi:cytochrome c-type biogenesis protein CcsB